MKQDQEIGILKRILTFAGALLAAVSSLAVANPALASPTPTATPTPTLIFNPATSANGLCSPSGVAVDPAGNLFVADTGNNRVIEYARSTTSPFAPSNPAMVFGQAGPTDFTDNLCNGASGVPSAATLCAPKSVATDLVGNLYVSDTGNNRVLVYNTPLNSKSGEPGAGDVIADNVFGNLFSTAQCNSGRASGDLNGVGPDSLCGPGGLAVDKSGNLYVADTNNNRALLYLGVAPTASTLQVKPMALNFPNTPVLGSQSAISSALKVTLSNPRSARSPIEVQNVFTDSIGDFKVARNGCTAVLKPGSQCSLSIGFSPVRTGPSQGFLMIFADSSNSPLTLNLNGVGVVGKIAYSPGSLGFGAQKVGRRSAAKFVTFTNRNSVAIGFARPAFAGADPSDFIVTSNDCKSLKPGHSCRIGVAFRPTAVGSRTAGLAVTDGVGQQVVTLAGVGRR